MVGFAIAATHPKRVCDGGDRCAAAASDPGSDQQDPPCALWLGGKDMERLVAGRERIYLDRFWNELSGTRSGLMK